MKYSSNANSGSSFGDFSHDGVDDCDGNDYKNMFAIRNDDNGGDVNYDDNSNGDDDEAENDG